MPSGARNQINSLALGRHISVHRFDRAGDDLHAGPLGAIVCGVLLRPQPAGDIDRESFADDVKRRDPFIAFPGGHIVPGGLYDRFAVPALVGEVCRNGEVRYPRVSDPENVDVADIPSDFKSVQLFHDSSSFEILSAAKLSRVSGAVSG